MKMKFYYGSPKDLDVLEPQQAKGIDEFQNKKAIFLIKDFTQAALYSIGKYLKGKTSFALPPGKLIIVGKFELPKFGYIYEVELDGRKVKKKKNSNYEFAWSKSIKEFKIHKIKLEDYEDKIFYVSSLKKLNEIIEDFKREYIPYEIYSKLKQHKSSKETGSTAKGVFGHGGAGILIVSKDKKKLLLFYRSKHVYDPLTGGITGGARKEIFGKIEESLITAVTETKEEMGKIPKGKIRHKPYVYRKPNSSFTYETYILEISEKEIKNLKPKLNWENTKYKWFDFKNLDKINLHLGVKNLLKNYKI